MPTKKDVFLQLAVEKKKSFWGASQANVGRSYFVRALGKNENPNDIFPLYPTNINLVHTSL
jgi:hypothetical protein